MYDKEKARAWYLKNVDEQRRKARARVAVYRSLNIRLRALYLSARPCLDCGEPPDPDNPFEFDHRDGVEVASRRVSNLVTRGIDHVKMLREFELCDVVCPRCHKKRTYDRGQWKRAV